MARPALARQRQRCQDVHSTHALCLIERASDIDTNCSFGRRLFTNNSHNNLVQHTTFNTQHSTRNTQHSTHNNKHNNTQPYTRSTTTTITTTTTTTTTPTQHNTTTSGLTVLELGVQEGSTWATFAKARPSSVSKSLLHIGDVVMRRQDTSRARVQMIEPLVGDMRVALQRSVLFRRLTTPIHGRLPDAC